MRPSFAILLFGCIEWEEWNFFAELQSTSRYASLPCRFCLEPSALCAVAPSSPQLGPFLKMFDFWKILMWGFIVEKRCIWNVRKCDKTQTFQNIIMPPKSDYWKYFLVQGVLAVCQISVEIDNWPPTVITQLLGLLNLLRMNLKMMKKPGNRWQKGGRWRDRRRYIMLLYKCQKMPY